MTRAVSFDKVALLDETLCWGCCVAFVLTLDLDVVGHWGWSGGDSDDKGCQTSFGWKQVLFCFFLCFGRKRKNKVTKTRKSRATMDSLGQEFERGSGTRTLTFYQTTENQDLRQWSRSGIGSESAQKKHGS